MVITLSTQAQEYSGGHQHDTTRPSGSFYADSQAKQSLGKSPKKTVTADSQGNAQFTVYYLPAMFGGIETITAQDSSTSASQDLTVSASQFTDFSQVSSNGDWQMTGQTTTHPNNHWYRSDAENAVIPRLQAAYTQIVVVVPVNDMSLQNGGLFDINGDWQRPHGSHRNGTSMDIDYKAYTQQQIQKLEDIMLTKPHQFLQWTYEKPNLHFEYCPSMGLCQ